VIIGGVMPNGEEFEEPEEGAPEEEEEKAPPDLVGYGRRAFDIGKRFGKKPGGGLGKKAAGKGAGKAAAGAAGKAGAGAAGKAAGAAAGTAVGGPLGTVIGAALGAIASKLAEKFGPKAIKWTFYILLAIFLLSASMAIAFWGLLGGGEYFGSRAHLEATETSQNMALAFTSDLTALRKALLNNSQKSEEILNNMASQLKTIDQPAAREAEDLINQLKEQIKKLSLVSDQEKAKKETEQKILQLYRQLETAISKLYSGKLVDFNDEGVVAGAIGPGSRHPITNLNYEVYRHPDPATREKIANEAVALIGSKTIDGKTRKEHPDQCAALPNYIMAKLNLGDKNNLPKITGSPPYQRGDLIHFIKPDSPYGTGNAHWAIAI
jgi:hypothetical protein